MESTNTHEDYGDRADNLETAIAVYTEELKFYTDYAFFEESAATQNNLANAYRNT
jgi:hypothetical protein